MKKILLYILFIAGILLTACSLERLPYGSMPDEQVKSDRMLPLKLC